jgi:tetratricopeptide (TPR) repeat protein
MLRVRNPFGVAFSAWLLATPFTASAEDRTAAPECNSLGAVSSSRCALLRETTTFYNAALAFERRGHSRVALDTYSQAVASANWSIELFLAGTVPARALLRRGIMHRELGQLDEAIADFTALIDADLGNPDARNERARTLLKLDRLNDALADSDAALWLKPHTADFHALRAEILARLGRHEEAAAALVEAKRYAPGSLTELERKLKGIGPGLSKDQWTDLSQNRELQELERALKDVAPMIIRQRFLLQRACPDDDRHILTFRVDQGRLTAIASYAGPSGTMAVEERAEKLVFTLGAERCQIRVVVGRGDLPVDTPAAIDISRQRPLYRHLSPETVERTFYPPSSAGCGRGTAEVRAYWGSVDHALWKEQQRMRARLDSLVRPPSKDLLFMFAFGEEQCRIAIQIWKAA